MNKTAFAACLLITTLAACSERAPPAPAADAPTATPTPASPPPAADPGALPALPSGGAVALEATTLAADAASAGRCALDVVNGKRRAAKMRLPAGSALALGGWISDAAKTVPASSSLVLRGTTGAWSAPLTTGVARPDVARVLGSEALATAGFNLRVSSAGVPAGSYRVLAIVDPATSAYCDLGVELAIG